MLALLICLVGSVFAASDDTGTCRIWVTAIGAPYYQAIINGISGSIHTVGTFAYIVVTTGYNDVSVQLLDFDHTPLGGASLKTRYNVYVAKNQTVDVFFNFDCHRFI